MKRDIFAIILSFIAIFFGIVAIYTSRPYNWDMDFVGLSFNIMFALITLLVAWNIYSAIDAKERINNIEKSNNSHKDAINTKLQKIENDSCVLHELIAEVRSSTSYMQALYLGNEFKNSMCIQTFSCFVNALYYSLDAGEGMIESNTELFLSLMERVLPYLTNKAQLSDNEVTEIKTIKERMEYIIAHPNKHFTPQQREKFAVISKEIRVVYSKNVQ